MPSPEFALDITGLKKSFDRPVVIDLELKVRSGEFYALLGPNGAGKTTILRMVAGLLQPRCRQHLRSAASTPRKTLLPPSRSSPGSPTSLMVYDRLTPLEYLEFVAGLWRIEPRAAETRSNELIDWLGLRPHANERCGGFSKRHARRRSPSPAPSSMTLKLIILDEPLTGLDAGSARQVKDVLKQKVASGVTVIMTTHILEVAERMAERIGVINHGRLAAEGTLAELRTCIGRETTPRGVLPRSRRPEGKADAATEAAA